MWFKTLVSTTNTAQPSKLIVNINLCVLKCLMWFNPCEHREQAYMVQPLRKQRPHHFIDLAALHQLDLEILLIDSFVVF